MGGWSRNRLEDDPNDYDGRFLLNNEEEYTILKCKNEYKFLKGKKTRYPNWNTEEDLIYKSEIDFDVYKRSVEMKKIREEIVRNINQILEDESNQKISEYKNLKKEIEDLLPTIL